MYMYDFVKILLKDDQEDFIKILHYINTLYLLKLSLKWYKDFSTDEWVLHKQKTKIRSSFSGVWWSLMQLIFFFIFCVRWKDYLKMGFKKNPGHYCCVHKKYGGINMDGKISFHWFPAEQTMVRWPDVPL